MGKSISTPLACFLLIVVLIASTVQLGYAYQAITENWGNGLIINQKSIMIYDEEGNDLECMELPHVEYTGSYNDWTVGYYEPHVSGKLEAKWSGSDSCKIRVWVETKDIRSWSAIEKITLRLQGNEYTLFYEKSANNRVTDQSNAQTILINSEDKGVKLDCVVNVTYKEQLTFNPYADENLRADFMVSKIMFVMDKTDPIKTIYSVTFKCNELENRSSNGSEYLKVTEDIFIGELVERPDDPTWNDKKWRSKASADNYRFAGWYKDRNTTIPWDFNNDRPEASDFNNQWDNLNLYANWEYKITFVFDDESGCEVEPFWASHGGKITRPADPVWDGHTFVGWFTAPSEGSEWDFDTTVTDYKKLYARWTVNPS